MQLLWKGGGVSSTCQVRSVYDLSVPARILQAHHFIHSSTNLQVRTMDFLKKMSNQQGNAATQQGDAAAQQSNTAAGGEQEDYVDKGNLQNPSLVNGYLTSLSQVSMLSRASSAAARSIP
jgi:hypothetical protein